MAGSLKEKGGSRMISIIESIETSPEEIIDVWKVCIFVAQAGMERYLVSIMVLTQ
jgi:hypothetical protein